MDCLFASGAIDDQHWYEIERCDNNRDLLFANNPAHDVIYFTARDHKTNERYAGIVKEMSAIFAMMAWVCDDSLAFPIDCGIELG